MNPKVIIVRDPRYKWRLMPHYTPTPDRGEFGKAMKILERAGITQSPGDWVFEGIRTMWRFTDEQSNLVQQGR